MTKKLFLDVRDELYERDMTQMQLAEKVGISAPYLTDILRGRRKGPKAQQRINEIKKILEIK